MEQTRRENTETDMERTNIKTEVKEWLKVAEETLDRHSLDDAQQLYLKILNKLSGIQTEMCFEKYSIAALMGLASIFSKIGRRMRHQIFEWQGILMCAASFLNEAIRRCTKIMHNVDECGNCISWAKSAKEKSAYQYDILRECLAKSITSIIYDKTQEPPVNSEWLTALQAYCRQRIAGLHNDHNEGETQISDISTAVDLQDDNANVVDSEESNNNEPEDREAQKVVNTVQIDFDQIQTAIMSLVRQVSFDVRQRHIRKNLPEEMLRRSVSCEMLFRVTSQADPHKDSAEEQDYLMLDNKSTDPNMMQNVLQSTPESFSKLDNRNANTYEEYLLSCPCVFLSSDIEEVGEEECQHSQCKYISASVDDNCNPREIIPVTPRHRITPRHRRPDVLTIWRSFPKSDCSDLQYDPPYILPSFEELSPLTETKKFVFHNELSDQIDVKRGFLTSLHDCFNETTATLLHTVASKFILDGKKKEAVSVITFSIGVLQENHNCSEITTSILADIFKSLGSIKCADGDLIGGSTLMEEAVGLMELVGGSKSAEVADVWHQLGNAYASHLVRGGALVEHTMKMVKDHLTEEATYDDYDDDSDSDDSEGDTYSVCIYEAMACYNEAKEILQGLSPHHDKQVGLYVDNLRRLGDCNIIIGNYDRAVLYYEEAVSLVKETSGPDGLQNYAHVLSMLGTANFLLGNYYKAVSIFVTADILHQKAHHEKDENKEILFLLMMLSVSFFLMRQYHKSISWCFKAHERDNWSENLPPGSIRHWFRAQTMYILGFSYSTVTFHKKSLQYLNMAKEIIIKEQVYDTKLHVRVLKAIADAYANTEENEKAIDYYNQAIEVVGQLGQETSATALQNQLLNAMAGVHVSSSQFSDASMCLEQGLSCQKNVESSIQSDLFDILLKLGGTYMLTGEVDKAIECFDDCLHSSMQVTSENIPDICQCLCHLGNLKYVKFCVQEEHCSNESFLEEAKHFFEEAIKIDFSFISRVQYGNFLYNLGLADEALFALLPMLCSSMKYNDGSASTVTYHSLCYALLPEHIQNDIDDMDETTFVAEVLGYFLSILAYKYLGLLDEAFTCLEKMCFIVYRSNDGLSYSLLGYALMEMDLFFEAAESFDIGTYFLENKQIAIFNKWLNICVATFTVFQKALMTIHRAVINNEI